jgi:ammonia channel protein AmtB
LSSGALGMGCRRMDKKSRRIGFCRRLVVHIASGTSALAAILIVGTRRVTEEKICLLTVCSYFSVRLFCGSAGSDSMQEALCRRAIVGISFCSTHIVQERSAGMDVCGMDAQRKTTVLGALSGR